MIFKFQVMQHPSASEIVTWNYGGIYGIYDFSKLKEEVSELMNGDYFEVKDERAEIIGFLCCGESARVPGGYKAGIYKQEGYVDIGIGLKPDLTGKGHGLSFINQCMNYLTNPGEISKFRLVVAQFNERAIKVYEKAGFKKDIKFESKVHGNKQNFLLMKRDVA